MTDVDEDLLVGWPTSFIGLPNKVSQVLLSVHKLAVWMLALSLGLGAVLVATVSHAQERFEFEPIRTSRGSSNKRDIPPRSGERAFARCLAFI